VGIETDVSLGAIVCYHWLCPGVFMLPVPGHVLLLTGFYTLIVRSNLAVQLISTKSRFDY